MALNSITINSYKDLLDAFDHYDAAARKYKYRRFIPAWVIGLGLGYGAVYCFALMVVFGVDSEYKVLINSIEVVAVMSSFLLLTKVANHYYGAFLLNRRIAEVLRNHILLADHNIAIPSRQVRCISAKSMAHAPGEPKHNRDFYITFNPFSTAQTLSSAPAMTRSSLLAVLNAQIAHHQDARLEVFKKRKKQLNVILACVKYAFLGIILAKFVAELLIDVWHLEGVHPVSQVLSFYVILLPALYAGLEGVKYFSDWQRNMDIAGTKVKELSALKDELLLAADDALPAWTTRLQLNLDTENMDWLERNVTKKLEPLI